MCFYRPISIAIVKAWWSQSSPILSLRQLSMVWWPKGDLHAPCWHPEQGIPLENYSIMIQELEVRMLQLTTFFAFVKLLVCRTYHCNRQRRCVWVFVVVVAVFCLFHFVCLASGTPCSWGCSVITVFLQPVTSGLNKDGPIWTLISWSGLCTFDQHLKELKSCKIIKTKIEEIEILWGGGEKSLCNKGMPVNNKNFIFLNFAS